MSHPVDIPYYVLPGEAIYTFPLCNKTIGKSQTVFVSQDALDKYKAFNGVGKGSSNHQQVSELQNQGLGMPLFRNDCRYMKWYGGRVITLYQCVPPQPGNVFSKSDIQIKACTVEVKYHKTYKRYKFEFHELGKTIYFYRHIRFPFGDFLYNGKRYRWVRFTNYMSFRTNDYSYTLYELEPHQVSLVDNINSNNEIDKKNLLLGSSVKTFFFQSLGETNFDYSKFVAQKKVGFLEFLPFNNIMGFGSLQMNSHFTMPMPQRADPNSCKDVPEKALVFTAMACLLKLLEDYTTEERQSN